MQTWQFYECNTSFREYNDPNCICNKATHGHWNFGDEILFDIDNCDGITTLHKEAFKSNNFLNCDQILLKDDTNSYFVNCKCAYCVLTSNSINDVYELCFCCKSKLYTPTNYIIRCEECNSIICEKCYIHGKYREKFYCFECRRFSLHKNANYYFANAEPNIFNMHDDWEDVSWYY